MSKEPAGRYFCAGILSYRRRASGRTEKRYPGRTSPDKEAGETRELIVKEELRQIDSFQKNHTYMDEQLLYDHIKEGDTEYLEKQDFYEAPSHPIIIEDLKKNEEYMTVISISLAARAAIEGGLSSAEGFINNDIYLKKLSQCKTVFEMDRLRRESQIYFARLVADHKKKSSVNFHVEEVKKNIISKRFAKYPYRILQMIWGFQRNICRNYLRNMKEPPLRNIFLILRSRRPVICSGIQTGRFRKSQNTSTMEALAISAQPSGKKCISLPRNTGIRTGKQSFDPEETE